MYLHPPIKYKVSLTVLINILNVISGYSEETLQQTRDEPAAESDQPGHVTELWTGRSNEPNRHTDEDKNIQISQIRLYHVHIPSRSKLRDSNPKINEKGT